MRLQMAAFCDTMGGRERVKKQCVNVCVCVRVCACVCQRARERGGSPTRSDCKRLIERALLLLSSEALLDKRTGNVKPRPRVKDENKRATDQVKNLPHEMEIRKAEFWLG